MLLDFEVSNFLSFNNKVTLSMQSGYSKANIFKDNIIFHALSNKGKKTYIHNAAIMYGANASGKSNLISAISFLKNIVENSNDSRYSPKYFKFVHEENPTEFGISFIQGLSKQLYEISYKVVIDRQGIIQSETLKYSEISNDKKGKEYTIFDREQDGFIKNHDDLNFLIENFKTKNIENRAALSFFIHDINKSYFKNSIDSLGYQLLEVSYNFIVDKMVLSNDSSRGHSDIADEIMNNSDFKKKVIIALNEIDNNIVDFNIIDITETLSERFTKVLENDKDEKLRDELEKNLEWMRKRNKKFFEFNTIHNVNGENYSLGFRFESSGTKKFIEEFIDIIDCIENNKVYIVDEIEDHYHEFIQNYIVNLFLNQGEGKTSQLIASTHSLNYLDPDRFAKEQIWFVEKDRVQQESELYRLSEFKDVSYNNHNWKNLYIQGRLGAVPKVIM